LLVNSGITTQAERDVLKSKENIRAAVAYVAWLV
jgi:hypothetical protein